MIDVGEGLAMEDVFDALKVILGACSGRLVVVADEPGHYSLDTRHVMPNGKVLWFGAVRIGKRHVAYHLMPIYIDATLSAFPSDALTRRRQGKSCFNFRTIDETLFVELADLTARGLRDYERRGYLR